MRVVLCLMAAGASLPAHGRPVTENLELPYSEAVKDEAAELSEDLDRAQAAFRALQPPPPAPATITRGLRERFYNIFIRYGFLMNRQYGEFKRFAGAYPSFKCTDGSAAQKARAKQLHVAGQWEAFGAMPLDTPEQKAAAALAAQSLSITTMLAAAGYVGLPLPCAFELIGRGQAAHDTVGVPRGR